MLAVRAVSAGLVVRRPVVTTVGTSLFALGGGELSNGRRSQISDGGQVRARYRLVEADVALEAAGIPFLVGLDERDHHAVLTSTGSSTGTVYVGLVILGRVVVDDRSHAIDVDASGRHVGGHQRVHATAGEVGECSGALALAASTVDGGGFDLGTGQLLGEAVGAVPGPAEDDGRPGGSHGFGGQVHSGGLVDRPEEMGRRSDVGRFVADLVTHRIVLVVAGQLGNVTVQRRRKQHGLAVVGRLVEQASDGGHEAHVGHPVGLVEDDPIDVAEIHGALVDEVLEATRAGDEDVDAVT